MVRLAGLAIESARIVSRSHHLQSYLDLMAGESANSRGGVPAIGSLGRDAPRFVAIVDTNALLSSVDNDCRNDRDSRIVRLAKRGTCNFFAPDHVYEEMYEKLPEFASKTIVPLPILRSRFAERYLPLVRFVTVGDRGLLDDPQVIGITDADDVPTGVLAKCIAPCVVFSADKHLRRPGFAPAEWRMVAGAGTDLAIADDALMGSAHLSILGGVLVAELVKGTGRRLGVATSVVALGVGGLAMLYLADTDRRSATRLRAGRVLNGVGAVLADIHLKQEEGISDLREAMVAPMLTPDIPHKIAAVLARSSTSQLVPEVQVALGRAWPDEPLPSVRELRSVILMHPMFTETSRYRWQLGRRLPPPT